MSMLGNSAPWSRRSFLLGAFAAGALLAAAMPGAAAAGSAVAAAHPTAAVEIHNFRFNPATLTITTGTTVTWTNDDATPHTVVENKGAFRSAALDTKDTFVHIFATPGEYVYRCTFHPMMVGSIIVKPAG
jgi:plastocyanin